MTSYTLYKTGLENPGMRNVLGKYSSALFSFGEKGGELLMKVALSPVDEEGAVRNLLAENPDGGSTVSGMQRGKPGIGNYPKLISPPRITV